MKVYDLAVIGAGIHGAGVAQAAAARGLSVVVIERREQGGLETSSASSKLIHGGLRYLETGQLRLVYECLREQKYLLRNAPQLVRMRTFFLPVYKGTHRRPLTIALGLLLYWLLSGCRTKPGFFPIDLRRAATLGLKSADLQALFTYQDAQTDDCLLTQAVLRSAAQFDCDLVFNCAIAKMEYTDCFRVVGAEGMSFSARTLVNAAGPWANQVAQLLDPLPLVDVEWVAGTHIVLDIPAKEGCVYCEAPSDGRAVFVLPWKGKTLVGTTERILASPNAVASDEEIDYLIEVYNGYFADDCCDRRQVVDVFSGTRVLPQARGSTNKRSRETLLVTDRTSQPAYVGIYGGKLTSYRATAEKCLGLLLPYLRAQGRSFSPLSQTKNLYLPSE